MIYKLVPIVVVVVVALIIDYRKIQSEYSKKHIHS